MNVKAPTPLEVTTSSRLRAWYLVHFRGYAVAQCKEVPKVTRLGRLTYECRWLLRTAPCSGSEVPAKPIL